MTETGPREIKALVPTLRGASNWHDWYRDLEKFLASKEENLWPIFTGAYHRPANIDPTNVAEISAAINKLQDETDQVAAFRASMAFIEMKDPDTVPTPLITADIALRHRARKQKEWDSLDRTVLDYIRAAVSAPIAVHVTYGVTSHAVHNQLRHVYGSPSLKMRHNMYAKWTQYRYKGSNPDELVRKWRQALQDILDMHPDHVNPDWVSYYQFIQAIASCKECHPFLDAVEADPSSSSQLGYEHLVPKFIAFEHRCIAARRN